MEGSRQGDPLALPPKTKGTEATKRIKESTQGGRRTGARASEGRRERRATGMNSLLVMENVKRRGEGTTETKGTPGGPPQGARKRRNVGRRHGL